MYNLLQLFFTCLTYCIFSHIIVVKLMFDNYYRYCLITENAIFSISIYYVHKQKDEVLFYSKPIKLTCLVHLNHKNELI